MGSNLFLTEDEITYLKTVLHNHAPYYISAVTKSRFILGKQKGYYHHEGYRYTYQPATDDLVRDDVLSHIQFRRKHAAKKEAEAAQNSLF